MNLRAALWAETLKTRRAGVAWLVLLGFCIVPAFAGLFMIILKDPEAARSMGLISAKANLIAGEASWATFFNMMGQAAAVGGAILFGILTAWVFGREYSDRTIKELLALPTTRTTIVTAKFLVLLIWTAAISVLVFAIGLIIGSLVNIPGWSPNLLQSSALDFLGASLLTVALLPWVAFAASWGKGYLPAVGWLVLTLSLGQIAAITGWGDYFPWAVPALFSGAVGPRSAQLGIHSYLLVFATSVLGIAATLAWWRYADQSR